MRNFRRLPPLLRVASVLGLLCALASITMLVSALITSYRSFPQSPPDFTRELVIGLDVGMLGGACSFAVTAYSGRFRRPDRGSFLLSSWQSQLSAILLVAALPSCALALALVAPLISLPLSFISVVVTAISGLASLMLFWAVSAATSLGRRRSPRATL